MWPTKVLTHQFVCRVWYQAFLNEDQYYNEISLRFQARRQGGAIGVNPQKRNYKILVYVLQAGIGFVSK